MHLCYEQATFNCPASPPYLHITRPIAASCTTSWDDLPCLLLISVRALCYRQLVTTVYTSRSVAARTTIATHRHISAGSFVMQLHGAGLTHFLAACHTYSQTAECCRYIIVSMLHGHWCKTLNMDFVRTVSCHIRRHRTCSVCSSLQAVTLV